MKPSQHQAIASLERNDTIVIVKADKGNATVVLDKSDYMDKCYMLLQPPTYKKLKKDPTQVVKKKNYRFAQRFEGSQTHKHGHVQ